MLKVCTDVITDKFEIQWTIKRFKTHYTRVTSYSSIYLQGAPVLRHANGDELALCMHIQQFNTNYLCRLELRGNFDSIAPREERRVITTCCIVHGDGTRLQLRSNVSPILLKSPLTLWQNTDEDFIKQLKIKDYDDDLIVEVRIEIIDEVISLFSNSAIFKPESESLPRRYVELFENEKFTDITFVFDDKRLRAHKVICAGRSSVFAAMFKSLMEEGNGNEVEIDDIDYDVFKKMLQYIYTNEVDDLKEVASDLLYAADEYDLQELKEKCAESIWERINLNNVLEALIFARRHNVKRVMEWIRMFLNMYISDVVKTPGFKSMQNEHPDLAFMVIRMSLGMLGDE